MTQTSATTDLPARAGAPVSTGSPAIVHCDRSGAVVYMNRSAHRLTHKDKGRKCWQTVGELEGARGLPCAEGCVQRLLAEGGGHANCTRVHLPDGQYNLSCVGIAGQVVCVMARSGQAPQSWQRVTPRERDVLRLLAAGQTTKCMAEALGVSEATVRTHIEHMRRRLGISTRAGLVGCGYELGLL